MKFFLKRFGDHIRLFRLAKGLTQENIADQLGISGSAYAKIERGQSDITISRIEEIACIFGLTTSQLISITDTIQKTSTLITSKVPEKPTNGLIETLPDQIALLALLSQQIQSIHSLLEDVNKRLEKLEGKM